MFQDIRNLLYNRRVRDYALKMAANVCRNVAIQRKKENLENLAQEDEYLAIRIEDLSTAETFLNEEEIKTFHQMMLSALRSIQLCINGKDDEEWKDKYNKYIALAEKFNINWKDKNDSRSQ